MNVCVGDRERESDSERERDRQTERQRGERESKTERRYASTFLPILARNKVYTLFIEIFL